ncbi:MAG: hypothetical protein HC945_00715 [Nitrosarchaeum sp.]|nr:hypothetical protein [Nitrosarchaeum sp.]
MSCFVTFGGIENCGKGTQIGFLEQYLRGLEVPYVVAREPGGTAYGEAERLISKHPVEAYTALAEFFEEYRDFRDFDVRQERGRVAEMFSFLAARAEFVEKVVGPALDRGVWVIADRFDHCTEAYQGGGLFWGDEEAARLIRDANAFITRTHRPVLSFILDVDVDESLRRGGMPEDVIESRPKEYFERVRHAYRGIALGNRERYVLVDGMHPPEVVWSEGVLPGIERLLGS